MSVFFSLFSGLRKQTISLSFQFFKDRMVNIFSEGAPCFSALPRAPSQVRMTEVQSTSVRLSWSYDGDAASEVQYYVIQYKPKVIVT